MQIVPTIVYIFLKDSFFIMYLYIFGPLRWMRSCAITGIVITTAFYISITIAMLVFVTPHPGETWFEHFFSPEDLRSNSPPIIISSFGLVTDLFILILPIIAVSQLQLPTRRKIGVTLIFTTGLLYVACVF